VIDINTIYENPHLEKALEFMNKKPWTPEEFAEINKEEQIESVGFSSKYIDIFNNGFSF